VLRYPDSQKPAFRGGVLELTAWVYLAAVSIYVGAVVAYLIWKDGQRKVKRASPDDIDAAISAIRGRCVDMEDRIESYIKRDAVRSTRALKEKEGQLPLMENDSKMARMSALRARHSANRAMGA